MLLLSFFFESALVQALDQVWTNLFSGIDFARLVAPSSKVQRSSFALVLLF